MKILFGLFFFCAMTKILMAESIVQTGERDSVQNVLQVNLIQLLATPEKFANKKVRFTAYVVRNNSDTFLFNSRDDFENFRLDSALMGFLSDRIDLKLFLRRMDKKLLWVEGIFTVQDRSSSPAVAGLVSISYLRYQ